MKPRPLKNLFLITGTTRGIGKALTEAALKQPHSYVISLSRAAPFLSDHHQNLSIDLKDSQAIGPVFQHIDLQQRPTDALTRTVLINNAAVLDPVAPIVDSDDRLLSRNIRVNLIAPLILSRHFFHFCNGFAGQKWIVNITSGAGRSPYYGWSAYGAAKAGLDMATAAMALEFPRIDPAFRVCAVAPGTVDTAMQTKIRSCTARAFADVEKFIALKAAGALHAPERTAASLMRLLMNGGFENGGLYDLRQMGL